MSADACGPAGCGDCTFACAGGRPGQADEELTVAAAGGIAIAVLAGVLALGTTVWVTALAGATALGGAVLAAAALVARSRGAAGSTAGPAARLLPLATGGLVATVLARAATSLLA